MNNRFISNNTENANNCGDRTYHHKDGDTNSWFPPHELGFCCHICVFIIIRIDPDYENIRDIY